MERLDIPETTEKRMKRNKLLEYTNNAQFRGSNGTVLDRIAFSDFTMRPHMGLRKI